MYYLQSQSFVWLPQSNNYNRKMCTLWDINRNKSSKTVRYVAHILRKLSHFSNFSVTTQKRRFIIITQTVNK